MFFLPVLSRYTSKDPFECEKCNCNGHSDECHYDTEVDAQGLSVDIYGKVAGGAVCDNCQHNTAGNNCHFCADGFFRKDGVPANDTNPCTGTRMTLFLYPSPICWRY